MTVRSWYPERELILVGDGGYASETMLKDLPEGVTFVGRLAPIRPCTIRNLPA